MITIGWKAREVICKKEEYSKCHTKDSLVQNAVTKSILKLVRIVILAVNYLTADLTNALIVVKKWKFITTIFVVIVGLIY